MKTLLEVENLHVTFSISGKRLRAVRGISFAVHEGQAVGIVGESGCGKSSAVQALTRLTNAETIEGKVWFQNEDLLQKKPEELRSIRGKDIGMVFQDPMASLNPTMTIGKQITEGLLHHDLCGKKEALARAIELLHLVGVPEAELRVHQYPSSLSGGMRQRVLIATALACKPSLLIADEPTTALDVTISAQILDLFRSLQKKLSTALLVITHDLHVVSSLCDYVLVMYAGKIVEQGPVEQILNAPKHPYTQMLLQATARFERPRTEKLVPIEGSPPNLFVSQRGCSFAPRCPFAREQCRTTEPPMLNGVSCWNVNT